MSYLWIAGVVGISFFVGGAGATWFLTKLTGQLIAKNAQEGWQTDEDIVRLLRAATGLLFAVVLVMSLIPWSMVLSTLGGMADQFFRNTVNRWMSRPDLFQHLAIDEHEYHRLPLGWRQALAEIVLRPDDGSESVKQLVSTLSAQDLELLERVSKYSLGNQLLDPNDTGGLADAELSSEDLAYLESRGLAMNSRLPLIHLTSYNADGDDELLLMGRPYALRLRVREGSTGPRLSFVELTDHAKTLFDAARRPTSIRYLCELVGTYRSPDVSTEIWSTVAAGQEGYFELVADVTSACDATDAAARP